jgi:tetrapyrrole methylase family protein/MazG family protein
MNLSIIGEILKKRQFLKEILMEDKTGFVQLVAIIDKLLGPNGCPWDKKQTVSSLSHMLLEEMYEVIDDVEKSEKLADELGDVWMTVVMVAKAAEREGRFSWNYPLSIAAEKLIRRHPHIFGEQKELTPEEVEKQWIELKKEEKIHKERKGKFDGIANSLPALSRVQKILRKAKDDNGLKKILDAPSVDEEVEYGRSLANLVFEAEQTGIQAEVALRKFCSFLVKELA